MKHDLNPRRKTLIALGASTFTAILTGELTYGLAAHAQGSAPPARIGIIWPTSVVASAPRLAAFRQGMGENGLIEGKHYILDVVSADGDRSEERRVGKECA